MEKISKFGGACLFVCLVFLFCTGVVVAQEDSIISSSSSTSSALEVSTLDSIISTFLSTLSSIVEPSGVTTTEAESTLSEVTTTLSCHGISQPCDSDYCSSSCPCLPGFGDCDSDEDCTDSVCVKDAGGDYGCGEKVDVCVKELVLQSPSTQESSSSSSSSSSIESSTSSSSSIESSTSSSSSSSYHTIITTTTKMTTTTTLIHITLTKTFEFKDAEIANPTGKKIRFGKITYQPIKGLPIVIYDQEYSKCYNSGICEFNIFINVTEAIEKHPTLRLQVLDSGNVIPSNLYDSSKILSKTGDGVKLDGNIFKLSYGMNNFTVSFNAPQFSDGKVDFNYIIDEKYYFLDDPYYNATGGIVTYDGLYTVHTFTANGTFVVNGTMDVAVLVVGGGGGGGSKRGGGGGAGGLVYNATFTVTEQSYTVTVGGGGTGATAGTANAVQGQNSSFSTLLVAVGGGAGGGYNGVGGAGGSGGGGGSGEGGSYTYGAGTTGQGYNGGSAVSYGGGGGGGASAVGANHNGGNGGNGGNGLAYTIYNSTSIYYAGGGGGGEDFVAQTGGTGGQGGGGAGGDNNGSPGTANTGGGGGGGGDNPSFAGGAGGSGIVIVRYLTYVEPPLGSSSSSSTSSSTSSSSSSSSSSLASSGSTTTLPVSYIKSSGDITIAPAGKLILNVTKIQIMSLDGSWSCCGPDNSDMWGCSDGEC